MTSGVGRREKIFAILFSVALIAVAWVALLSPAVGNFRNARANARLLEARYSAGQRLLLQYDDNVRELAELNAARGVLRSDEMLPALAEIAVLSEEFGLHTVEFLAAEVSGQYFEVLRFYEQRVLAEYEGAFSDLAGFLQEIAAGNAVTRSFSLESDRLRLEFSIFGGG